MITVATQYGIDFSDDEGQVIREYIAPDKQTRDDLVNQWETGEDNPLFPPDAKTIFSWQRNITRPAVCGVDYGPGSVNRRFGGKAPRGAYQFRG